MSFLSNLWPFGKPKADTAAVGDGEVNQPLPSTTTSAARRRSSRPTEIKDANSKFLCGKIVLSPIPSFQTRENCGYCKRRAEVEMSLRGDNGTVYQCCSKASCKEKMVHEAFPEGFSVHDSAPAQAVTQS